MPRETHGGRAHAATCAAVLVAFAALVAPMRAAAQVDDDDSVPESAIFATPPMVDTLDNGLTVVTVPWNTPGVVSYYTLVEVGSRDEVEPGRSGFAHLFEHMMFRGTENLPAEEYELALQAFGADTNAYTTSDYTVYTITAPAHALPRIVEVEADRFQNLSYTEEQYRTETGAVLGEYNTGASSPRSFMWETISEMAFSEHTYSHTTLGYLEDICAMPEMLDYSQLFFERYYTPDNSTVIAVGDVDREALLELVQSHYGAWEGERYDNQVPVEPEPTEGDRRHIIWPGATPPRATIAFRAPAFDGQAETPEERADAIRRIAALDVVAALAFDESSPLYQRLVVDEQRLTSLSAWSAFRVDPGLFTVSATLRPSETFSSSTDFDLIIDAVQAELDGISAGEIDPERVAAVQSNIRYSTLAALETPGRIASTLAGFITYGGSVEALDEYIRALDLVTVEDIQQAAGEYLVPSRRFIATVATAGEGEQPMQLPSCDDYADPATEEASR